METPASPGLFLALTLVAWSAPQALSFARPVQDPKAAPAAAPDNERLAQAWSFLLPDEQHEAAELLSTRLKGLETFQQSMIDFARSLDPRDQSQFPLEPEEPFYSPEVHAPRQPIVRKRLAAEDPGAKKQHDAMFAVLPKNGLDSAWRYDWALREVQRTKDDRDPTRIFMNSIAGFPPDLDLGIALIERALDDGKEQRALTAFGHAYTDRSGTVFPGLTLYDALSSGLEIEMPDVDVLGVIHDLSNDWKTWTAPVPEPQHDALYDKVGEYYTAAKRHRGLRSALAMTFFSGSIGLRDGYTAHRDRLHSWWDERASTPAEVLKDLPASADWALFLEKWSARIDDDANLTQRGILRRATLDSDAARVRTTAVEVLQEFSGLERKSRPALPPKPAPEGKQKQVH